MSKKTVLLIVGAVLFLAIGLWLWNSEVEKKNAPATPVTSDIIFFYGQECPHCQEVEKFINDNKIGDRVKFDSLEIWHNGANQKIMAEKARECQISEDKLGVPFLFARGKCYVGTPEVENFLRQEAGLNQGLPDQATQE